MESISNYLVFLVFLLPLLYFLSWNKSSKRVPPGPLGLPVIGHSLIFLKGLKTNKCEEWLQERINKYGPVSKLSLFGVPTVFIHGLAANKFIYTSPKDILANHQPASMRRLLGERNILELNGEDYKRVRGALLSFLKPEALKQSVGRMDEEVKIHLKKHWQGRQEVAVMPLMKILTFDIVCSLIFGVERGARREKLVHLFEHLQDGMLTVPINLPFTPFNRSLRERLKIREIMLELISEKRAKLENGEILPHQDLISSLISLRNMETNLPLLSDEEIVDNSIFNMVAGHETTSTLITSVIKILAENLDVYNDVLEEHEEIARGKVCGELLEWEDLAKMKYTWRVATESFRMNPPIIGFFRKALKDIEFGGYTIPKGWQVFSAFCMTQMDGSIFEDPSKFNPSRFENQGVIPTYSYVAFGAGPRICPGIEFARIETLTIIHYLIRGFQWELSLAKNFVCRKPMLFFDQGLPVRVHMKNTNYEAM